MSKHKHSGLSGDLKDLGICVLGLSLCAFVLVLIAIIQLIIAFWYVAVVVLGCTMYLYAKKHTGPGPVPVPSSKIIETHEEVKINNGIRKIHTTEKYDQSLPMVTNTYKSLLSKIIRSLI